MSTDKRTWVEPFEIRDLTIHVDDRGRLFEILRFLDDDVPGQGYIYTFSVNPGVRRGDHYHHIKREWFTCVHGSVTVLLDDLKGRTAVVELIADKPAIVYAGPGTTHALLNQTSEAAVVLSYGSRQHEHGDPDTYRAVAVKSFSPDE
jgi:dTDP-4-dehydrorhamnose 3,5-epimerase-like enzyme